MSKEMSVIILGLVNIAVATNLIGIPSSWKTVLFVLSGITLMIIGFLMRAETLGKEGGKHAWRERHTFVESSARAIHEHTAHDSKEGITSFN